MAISTDDGTGRTVAFSRASKGDGMPVTAIESETLDSIYLGCSDLKNWFRMLGRIGDLVGADSVACCHDVARPGPERTFTASDDTLPDESVYERIMDRAGRAASVADMPASCIPVGPAEDADGHWLLLRDDVSQTRAMFLLHRERGAFTGPEAEYLMHLAPHLFRAVRLQGQIAQATSRAKTALALLDLLRTPVFLVDARFSVVLSNIAAQDLERKGTVRLNRQRLSFECHETMKRAQQVITSTGEGGDVSEQERLIRFKQPDGSSLLAVIEPLDGLFTGKDNAPDDAVAAIFLKDPERPVRSIEAVMREMHGMPPAEARLAAAIADGRTIREYAVDSDLSEGYVRDLSKRVMQRLGVKRQQQLVRAIIQTAPEIGG